MRHVRMRSNFVFILIILNVTGIFGQGIPEINCTNDSPGRVCYIEYLELDRNNYRFKPVTEAPENVTTLNILSSTLAGFPRTICDTFYNLQDIWVSQIKMEFIEDGALDNCKDLETFLVWGNRLRRIPKDLFLHTRKIRSIALSDNELIEIDQFQFTGLENLLEMTVFNNELNEFPASSIVGTNLVNLDIFSNNIHYLDLETILNGVPNLSSVMYDNNEFPCELVTTMNRLVEEKGIELLPASNRRKRYYEIETVGTVECLPVQSWTKVMKKKSFEARFKVNNRKI